MLAIQGYNFIPGNRFLMSTIEIRGVCADLTALPFLEQRLNGSFFCIGARAVGGWAGDLLGLGMPLPEFERMVIGMERSAGDSRTRHIHKQEKGSDPSSLSLSEHRHRRTPVDSG